MNELTKGFVTVVSGDEIYYKNAVNLLNSYRHFSKNPLPFTIIADRENDYTKQFDNFVLLKKSDRTYTDKIEVLLNIPYNQTIFIEPDILAYGDLNEMFSDFEQVDGFSMQGNMFELDSGNGWFLPEETKKYKDKIRFVPSFSSGMMYLNDREKCKKIYDVFADVLENFDEYNIGGNRNMLDDKCLSVAVAANNCKILPFNGKWPLNYPFQKRNKLPMKINIRKGRLSFVEKNGNVVKNGLSCHWSTEVTKQAFYQKEVAVLNAMVQNKKCIFLTTLKHNFIIFSEKTKVSIGRIIYKIKCNKFVRKLCGKK